MYGAHCSPTYSIIHLLLISILLMIMNINKHTINDNEY